jgi:hypothetical protein
MPLVWVSRWRGVISMVAPGSATMNSCSWARTGSSRAMTPAWTACMTSVAVYTLVIDPIWKRVVGSTGAPVATLVTPQAARWVSPSSSTPQTAPGTPSSPASSATRASSRVR